MSIVASGENLGVAVVFDGFDRADLAELEHDWRLDLVVTTAVPAACYRIVREPWSEKARSARAGARQQAEGLVRVAGGACDALVNPAGVIWISPGGKVARIAAEPAVGDRRDVNALIGAGLIHAMALAGRVAIHGMAAAIDSVGVLVAGQSMAGKSTLALALLHGGGRVVSDDFLVAELHAGRVEIRALRRDLAVREGAVGLIPPELRERFSSRGAGPGRMVLRREDAPERFAAAVTPEVVWFLDGSRGCAWFAAQEVSQAAALASLMAASSPLFVSERYHEERARALPTLAAIVESARCFSVSLGAGLLRAPGSVVRRLLARTRHGRG